MIAARGRGSRREVPGKREGNQHLRHEKQRNKGYASEHLDEHDANRLDDLKVAAAAQGQSNAEGQAQRYAGHCQQNVEHQPAPVFQVHHRPQAGNPTKQQIRQQARPTVLPSPQQQQRQQEHREGEYSDAFDGPEEGGVAGQRPPQCKCRQVRQQQQPDVHPHPLEAVREERERRGHRRDRDCHPPGDYAARGHPDHSQKHGDQQKPHLRSPEAVVSGARLVCVVRAQHEQPADLRQKAPVRAQ